MIDFEYELNKILKDDPLDILKIKQKNIKSLDQRLIDSFDEINLFIDKNQREPSDSKDINERKLYIRLKELKKDFEKITVLRDFDKHNLFKKAKSIKTVDDILENDVLGLLDDDPENIFNIKNIPKIGDREKADFIARRKPCKNFSKYEEKFKEVQKEIKTGDRKLLLFKESHLQEGRYYVLDGILSFLESIEKPKIKIFKDKTQGSRKRLDARIRCIFENGLESNMYLRSFQKELYNNGSTVIQSNEDDLKQFNEGFSNINLNDKESGYIYVLSSLSEKIEIQSIKNLYKIGYCTSSVEKRIENSEKETTFLMSGVKIVSAYKTFNLNPQKFENIIHNFFSERCLDIKVSDLNGKLKKPKEWYIVPIRIIEEAIQLIINNQIQNYKFDHINDKIIKI